MILRSHVGISLLLIMGLGACSSGDGEPDAGCRLVDPPGPPEWFYRQASDAEESFRGLWVGGELPDEQVLWVSDAGNIGGYTSWGRPYTFFNAERGLYGVTADAIGPRWVCGEGGLVLTAPAGEYYAWTIVETPTSADLHRIRRVGDSLWAVGTEGTVIRYDGSAWSLEQAGSGDLWDIWGDGSEHFAVGTEGVFRREASAWEAVPEAGALEARAIAGEAGALWVVGEAGSVRFFDGSAWTSIDLGSSATLTSVWVDAAGHAWVAADPMTVFDVPGDAPDSFTSEVLEGIEPANLTEISGLETPPEFERLLFAIGGRLLFTRNAPRELICE